jgi:myo-inositol-1(or 4)-monophosphatase
MTAINLRIASRIPDKTRSALLVAVRAAERAGEIVRQGYNQAERVVEEKGLGDLISKIDIECDQVIEAEIHRSFPDDVILSEELNPHVAEPQSADWIIDPLDATSAFLFTAAKDMPSVMIARLDGAGTGFSVVYFPLTREWFYAVKGHGAYKGARRLHCKPSPRLHEAWVEMNQYSDARLESAVFGALRENLRKPGGARLVTTSVPHSGVGARIAEGEKKLSAVIHDNNPVRVKQAAWDVVPVALILEEAGGVVVNLQGRPYDPFAVEPFVMAGSKAFADEVIKLALL